MTLRTYRRDSRRGQRAVERLVARSESGLDPKVVRSAQRIVGNIRRGGDRALLAAVRRFDGYPAQRIQQLRRRLKPEAVRGLPPGFAAAFENARDSVESFHARQRESHGTGEFRWHNRGLVIDERTLPLRRVGLYVPGGRFPYPSSAVMTAVPARLAGVQELVVVTPALAYEQSPALRHALYRLGIDEVWTVGGAHAIAALAYGTESIEPVDLIAGPGNVWVNAAKRLVAGAVGVDREAGPSEVVIVATGSSDSRLEAARADQIAADLLAQAEHDPKAIAVVITPDSSLARRVRRAIKKQISKLEHPAVVRQSLAALSCGFVVDDLERGLELAERIAPEHLQLMGDAEALASRIRNAGAVFVGAQTPTVLGDYVAGPSHVLPTGGSARFASGLGVQDFLRRSHTVQRHMVRGHMVQGNPVQENEVTVNDEDSDGLLRDAATLAGVEGLEAHRASAELRLEPET